MPYVIATSSFGILLCLGCGAACVMTYHSAITCSVVSKRFSNPSGNYKSPRRHVITPLLLEHWSLSPQTHNIYVVTKHHSITLNCLAIICTESGTYRVFTFKSLGFGPVQRPSLEILRQSLMDGSTHGPYPDPTQVSRRRSRRITGSRKVSKAAAGCSISTVHNAHLWNAP
jgi:hypothetical protein